MIIIQTGDNVYEKTVLFIACFAHGVFDAEPAVTASGANGATLKKEWNAETKTLILTVISNGMVTMNIKEK